MTGLRASTVGYCLSGTDRRANADAENIGCQNIAAADALINIVG